MKQKPDLRCVGGTNGSDTVMSSKTQMTNNPQGGQSPVLPTALLKARKVALEELNKALSNVFEKADDTFFEYADKASSNEEKNIYLETMRQLRLNRKEIERQFYAIINDKFKKLPNSDQANSLQLESVSTIDSLSLVANDDLEVSVALDGMIAKAKNKFGSQIYQLNTRVDALMLHVTVSDKNNPFHPQPVCEAFGQAVKIIPCDIKNRLVLFKLFDKFVVSHFDWVLDAANLSLANSGILPDLPGTPKFSRSEREQEARTKQEGEQAGETSEAAVKKVASEFFGQLQALMASVRDVPMVTDVVGGTIGSAAQDARIVSNNEVFDLLNRLQQVQPQGEDVVAGTLELKKFNAPKAMANMLLQRERDQGPERLNDTDSDVINLVSLLFDFILDDENLPIAIKATLGRLQIPYLKLAVRDHNFFNRSGHPARKLLNELARAGIGLNGSGDQLKKDMVFKKIQATAHRILQEFDRDDSLFDELLHDFTQFMQTEVRRAQLIEQRTKAAEEGKAKTEHAEQVALETVRQRVDGRVVPNVVIRLLTNGWTPVLKLIFLKYGPESNNWVGAVKTIDHLLLSVTPPKDDISRKKLFNIVPILLKNLRQGLNSVSFNPFEMGELFTELEQVQMKILRGEMPEHLGNGPADPAQDLVAAVSEDMERLGGTPLVQQASDKVTRLDVTRSLKKSIGADLPELEDDNPYLQKAKQVNVGTWLEFTGPEGSKTRCKLAAHIKSADKMIFVNRTGVKIDEKSTLGLAYALKSGEAIVLEDSQLFDRALQNVIGNLRKVKQSNL